MIHSGKGKKLEGILPHHSLGVEDMFVVFQRILSGLFECQSMLSYYILDPIQRGEDSTFHEADAQSYDSYASETEPTLKDEATPDLRPTEGIYPGCPGGSNQNMELKV